MTRSSRFKAQTFFREFPWVIDLLRKANYEGDLEEVHVKRIDVDFLKRVPSYRGATGSLVEISDSERIFLLGKDGEFLAEPRQSLEITHNEAYRDNREETGESVGEMLSCLQDPDSVVYAVCVHTGYRIQNHHSVGGFSVTVYKPPRGFSLKGWVVEQQRRAEQMLAAEIAEIDAEATLV